MLTDLDQVDTKIQKIQFLWGKKVATGNSFFQATIIFIFLTLGL